MNKNLSNRFLARLFSFLFGALILVSACDSGQKVILSKTIKEKTDSLLEIAPDFSGVILLSEKGIPVYHKAFGYLDIRTKTPLDTADIFELASISKQFTAMVIMMLKEEGKLGYDDPIEKFLPELPYTGISIRHLLNHTSGLPDYMQVMDQHWDKSKVAGNDDIIAYLKKYHPPILFGPGEKFAYSNTGYVLLASIAEKASGENFVSFCRKKIFYPLAMNSTDIRSNEQKARLTNFTSGSIWVPEKRRFLPADSFPSSNYNIWLGARKGPGRISSSSLDLLKWDQALYSQKLVQQNILSAAFTPAKLKNDSLSEYGFGWMLDSSNPDGRIVYHTGDNPGYSTEIIRYLDKNQTIIILCNNAHPKFDQIVRGLEQIMNKEN